MAATAIKIPHMREHLLVAEAHRELEQWKAKVADLDAELTEVAAVPVATEEAKRKERTKALREGGEELGKHREQQSRLRELRRAKADAEAVVEELRREFSRAHARASEEICSELRPKMVKAVQRQYDALVELAEAWAGVEAIFDELDGLGYAKAYLADARLGKVDFYEKGPHSDVARALKEMADAYGVG